MKCFSKVGSQSYLF